MTSNASTTQTKKTTTNDHAESQNHHDNTHTETHLNENRQTTKTDTNNTIKKNTNDQKPREETTNHKHPEQLPRPQKKTSVKTQESLYNTHARQTEQRVRQTGHCGCVRKLYTSTTKTRTREQLRSTTTHNEAAREARNQQRHQPTQKRPTREVSTQRTSNTTR